MKKQVLKARLTHLDGRKLDKFDLDNQERAEQAKREIERRAFAVSSIDRRQVRRNPPPPFTTSTLQQEASRKLKFSSKQTMSVAQGLYENGYITYMRTDSPSLSGQAIAAARAQAASVRDQAVAALGLPPVPPIPPQKPGKVNKLKSPPSPRPEKKN